MSNIKAKTAIVGAGLAGLLCACVFKDGDIYEAGGPVEQHRALLRFRDDSVSKLTGIPFKAVEVHKEICYNGVIYHHCANHLANMYSSKVTGAIAGRSIRNLDSVTRYIAPDDFYQQLVDRHGQRIRWNSSVNRDFFDACRDNEISIISTAPLNRILPMVRGEHAPNLLMEKLPIKVARLQFQSSLVDAYQTIYFPGDETTIYRASITGSTLIIESMGEEQFSWQSIQAVLEIFGIQEDYLIPNSMTVVDQTYGKIRDLPKDAREAILYELTHQHGIYSVGRFATWRNILLDDVVQDIGKVQQLISASKYGRLLIR